MSRSLEYSDPRRSPARWAQALGVSQEAVDLYLSSDVIDLHTCSFIWTRVFGYDLGKRHRPHGRGTPVLNQVDFPRAREGALTGIVWDITTNPFRIARGRARAFFANLRRLRRAIEHYPTELRLVRTLAEYRAARAAGLLASFIGIQGGNAVDASLDLLDRPEFADVSRVTLVHFTKSRIGISSNDFLRRSAGLSAFGRAFTAKLASKQVFVDLSHINRTGFFDALDAMPRDTPVLVTHTGVKGVRDVARNIDDEQVRAVARTGGVIGIIYQAAFIARTLYDYGLEDVADHIEHVVRLVGHDHLALGSDYDGSVILPRDMPDVTFQPRLVEVLLRRGWAPEQVRKLLGENTLRVLGQVRP